MSETFTACLIIVGNEILSGRTKDANLPFIAERLEKLGIPLKEVRVVADEEPAVVKAVNECRAVYSYVFTTGGIGPTHDDITSECIARAFGVRLIRDPRAVKLLQSHYEDPSQLNEARLRMANIPEGADLIDNPVSRAPGFKIGNVYVMAGVPRIMQAMFEGIAPGLRGGPPVLSRTVSTRLGEGVIAEGLSAIQGRFPDLTLGSYPYYRIGMVGTSLVARGTDVARLDAAAAELRQMIRALGSEPIEAPPKE
jgi:molybdenum cofactor synthesis domain-containing protein